MNIGIDWVVGEAGFVSFSGLDRTADRTVVGEELDLSTSEPLVSVEVLRDLTAENIPR